RRPVRRLSRREFLERSFAAAAGSALAGCSFGSAAAPPASPRVYPSQPNASPTRVRPEDLDTRWPIKRVVYVMLENRSFDHLFGRFPGVNGATTGDNAGKEVPLVRAPQWLPGDLPHEWDNAVQALNGGKMDGFAQGPVGGYYAYSQLHPSDVPNYWPW